LGHQERDIALAVYDGGAAAEATIALAEAIHGSDATALYQFIKSEASSFYVYGDDRGSNVHLVAAIVLNR
jgi:hypothetical protein